MHRLYLVRSVDPPPEKRPAKVISLAVRREARNELRRARPGPDRPRAA
jgi:hypothetical protein